jgi:hypothetical protein
MRGRFRVVKLDAPDGLARRTGVTARAASRRFVVTSAMRPRELRGP